MRTKTVSTLSPFQRFFRLLKPDKRQIGHIYLYALVGGIVNLSLPLGVQAVINLLGSGRVSTSLNFLVLLVICGLGLAGLLQVFQLVISEMLQRKIFTRAAFEFAYRIPHLQGDTQRSYYVPELINRFFDTLSVQKGLSKILLDFTAASLQALFGLILLSLYHPFFIVFSLLLILLVLLIFRFTGPQGLASSIKESKYKYEVVHWLEEVARTLESFKLSGSSPLPLQRTDTLVNGYLDAREEHFGVLKRQYIYLISFKVLVAAGLLILGGILVLEQQMNIGQFVAAEIIIILVMNSVEKLVLSMETIYDVLTALDKIGYVTDLPLENPKGSEISEAKGQGKGLSVDAHRLTLIDPVRNQAVLENAAFHLEADEKVALVGTVSSGRSLFLRLLAGLHTEYKGTLTYNNLPLSSLNLQSLRTCLGANLERHGIFAGSLLENITLDRPGISLQKVQEVVEAVSLNVMLSELSDGLYTRLQPEGRHLSESTIHKILLARALAPSPRLLLLEDPFIYLEKKCRQQLLDYLLRPDQPFTLVVSTRLPEIAGKFSKLILLDDHKLQILDSTKEMEKQSWYTEVF